MFKKLKNLASKVISNDIVVRASKTFVQAFIAVILVSDGAINKSVLSAALASGLSAVWNSLKEYKR